MAVDIETRCKNYFYNLNPLAQKFAKDIKNIREAYQDLWDNLSEEKQSEIINENIIAPGAVLKYAHIQNPTTLDTSNTYSWFTKSQLDLFECFKPNSVINDRNAKQFRPVVIRDDKKDGIVENKHSFAGRLQALKSSVLKPKSPPPPPPIVKPPSNSIADQNLSSVCKETDVLSSDIPKTGFDFLDNW